MDTRTKIMAATWENDTARKFQSDLTPVETISGKAYFTRVLRGLAPLVYGFKQPMGQTTIPSLRR